MTGVFFANDFISVTKGGEGEWQHLRPQVLGVVTEFYLSGAPLIETGGADSITSAEFFEPNPTQLHTACSIAVLRPMSGT